MGTHHLIVLFAILWSMHVWAENRTLVSVTPVADLSFYPHRNAPAKVISLNVSQIPAEISAPIRSLVVRVGDKVKKGQLLAKLDCRQFQLSQKVAAAQLEQINNNLAQDQRDLARSEKLLENHNIGEADFDRLRTTVDNRQAEHLLQLALLNIADLNVEHCGIKAPYTGVVSKRLANEGEMLAIGQAVVELIQLDKLEVSAKIALGDENSFTAAKAYTFVVQDKHYPLQLTTLLPVIEANSRSREARFIMLAEKAVSGSTGRLDWQSPTLHLPARFLQKRDRHTGLFILQGEQAKFVVVEGAQEGRPIPVSIAQDALLIVDGRYGLLDEQKVRVQKAHKDAAVAADRAVDVIGG